VERVPDLSSAHAGQHSPTARLRRHLRAAELPIRSAHILKSALRWWEGAKTNATMGAAPSSDIPPCGKLSVRHRKAVLPQRNCDQAADRHAPESP
jgi:hypothetical protein